MLIPLSGSYANGRLAIIDDEDFRLVIGRPWWVVPADSKTDLAYAATRTSRRDGHKQVMMHRLIIGAQDREIVDHKNGNGLDNRKSNLRLCSYGGNARNQRLKANNTSGYKGVSWNRFDSRWQAYITVNRKRIILGYYDNVLDAALMYDRAAKHYHGEFARTNGVMDGATIVPYRQPSDSRICQCRPCSIHA